MVLLEKGGFVISCQHCEFFKWGSMKLIPMVSPSFLLNVDGFFLLTLRSFGGIFMHLLAQIFAYLIFLSYFTIL